MGIAALDEAARSGIGIASFVSLGNKADVSGNDLIAAWTDDPDIEVGPLYFESFGNPAGSPGSRRGVDVQPVTASVLDPQRACQSGVSVCVPRRSRFVGWAGRAAG